MIIETVYKSINQKKVGVMDYLMSGISLVEAEPYILGFAAGVLYKKLYITYIRRSVKPLNKTAKKEEANA